MDENFLYLGAMPTVRLHRQHQLSAADDPLIGVERGDHDPFARLNRVGDLRPKGCRRRPIQRREEVDRRPVIDHVAEQIDELAQMRADIVRVETLNRHRHDDSSQTYVGANLCVRPRPYMP